MFIRNFLNDFFIKEPHDIESAIMREINANPNQDVYDIQKRHGLDAATLYFYRRMLGTQKVRAFRRIIDKEVGDFSIANQGVSVLIVNAPVAVGLQTHQKIVDQWVEMAQDAGFKTIETLVPQADSLLDGALKVKAKLSEMSALNQPIIVVSVSHGSGFVRFAIDQTPREDLAGVIGWINVSGLVFGSPIYHASPRKQRLLGRRQLFNASFSCEQKYFIRPVSDKIPAMVSFLGCKMEAQMSRADRKQYTELRHWGPNDGVIAFREYEKMPGFTIPLWGQGHIMNFFSDRAIFQKTLCYLSDLGRQNQGRDWKLADLQFIHREKTHELQL